MLTEEEIDNQISIHMYVDESDYFKPNTNTIVRDNLCSGAVCPSGHHTNDACKHCIGDYLKKDLIEIQPHLNWKNLKETILIAQVLGIK